MEVDFRFQLFMDSNPLGSTKLDLHGLTTQEAVERLEWWLEAKRKVGAVSLIDITFGNLKCDTNQHRN